jgi:hypothetical protein
MNKKRYRKRSKTNQNESKQAKKIKGRIMIAVLVSESVLTESVIAY